MGKARKCGDDLAIVLDQHAIVCETADEEIKRLRAALRFYADAENYKGLPPGYAFVPIDKDSGELARATLVGALKEGPRKG